MKTIRFAGALVCGALALGASPSLARAQDEGAPRPEGRPGPDGQPGGERRAPRGRAGMGLPIDELKAMLGLSDEQVAKLEEIQQEMRDAFRKAREDMQRDGDFDWTKMREKMREGRDKIRDQIRGILKDDQKPKFEDWVKKQDEQGPRGPGGPGGPMGPDPERMKKRLLEQAEKELILSPDEKAAVMPLVQKLLDIRAEVRVQGDKRREEFTTYVRKTTGSSEAQKAELTQKLAEYRKAREADDQKVKEAEQAVRDVLTIENEARLVAIGVLQH